MRTSPRAHETSKKLGQPRSALLDVTGVAERLAVNERHVRRLVAERRIPFIKWGHLLRFDPVEIDEWLDEQRFPTIGTP